MTVPMTALGLAPGSTIDFSVLAFDNYFSGQVSDAVEGLRFTPGSPRFSAVGVPFGAVPARGDLRVEATRAGVADAKSSEAGLLFMYRRNADREADILRAN